MSEHAVEGVLNGRIPPVPDLILASRGKRTMDDRQRDFRARNAGTVAALFMFMCCPARIFDALVYTEVYL